MMLNKFTTSGLLRLLIPLSAIAIGVFLLVGCIYLPIPEHSANWSQKDFRPFVESNNSPVRAGQTTRAQVIKLLGRPVLENADRHEVVYRYDTERDVVIWPICFLIQPGYRDSFAVAFRFDASDQLVGWEMAHEKGHLMGSGAISSPIMNKPDATEAFRPKRINDK